VQKKIEEQIENKKIRKKKRAKESSDRKKKIIKKGTNITLIPINIRPIL